MSELLTVIPVYNGVHYLRATLESLARQTRRPDRVVVIDDCSTDGTCALVESFEEISCELVRNEKNLGLFPNLNHALEYAEDTEFFHLLLPTIVFVLHSLKPWLSLLLNLPLPHLFTVATIGLIRRGT